MKFLKYSKFELDKARALVRHIEDSDYTCLHTHGPRWRTPYYKPMPLIIPDGDKLPDVSCHALHEDTVGGILANILREAFEEIEAKDEILMTVVRFCEERPEDDDFATQLRIVHRLVYAYLRTQTAVLTP